MWSPDVVPAMYNVPVTSYRQLHDTLAAGCAAAEENAIAIYSKLASHAAAELRQRGELTRSKTWCGRPPDLNIVMDDTCPCAPFEPAGADGVTKPSQKIREEQKDARLDIDVEDAGAQRYTLNPNLTLTLLLTLTLTMGL